VYAAACQGQVDSIRVLQELGANVNTPSPKGATPVFVAAREGHVNSIGALVELGADVNIPSKTGTTPAHVAVQQGHLSVIMALMKARCNIDSTTPDGCSSLTIAVDRGFRNISTFLVNMGADVKQCLQHSVPPHVDHIRELMSQFCDNINLIYDDNGGNFQVKCALLSLSKLMVSAFPGIHDGAAGATDDRRLFETNIAIRLRRELSNDVINRMQEMGYVLKRRLVRIAWRVYQSSLLLDGDRVSVETKTMRYVKMVCFLFDLTMLGDVLALRMTCKSNSERQRFPVCYLGYRELEAHLIEEFVAHASSRLVSTDVIYAVVQIHSS
jgi:hypothetical protein